MAPPHTRTVLLGLAGLALRLRGCAAEDQKRDLTLMPQTALKLWLTTDEGVDKVEGSVVQWNDLGHGMDVSAKQNQDSRQPKWMQGPSPAVAFNKSFIVTNPLQLFDSKDSGLSLFCMFQHAAAAKTRSVVLMNFGSADLKLLNTNMEIGIKYKGDVAMFFVHRGAGKMSVSKKTKAPAASGFHLLSVVIDKEGVHFFFNGKTLATVEQKGGWLKSGSFPTNAVPVDVGARVNGNTHKGTIMGHMKGSLDMAFEGAISELAVYGKAIANEKRLKLETLIRAAQDARTAAETARAEKEEAEKQAAEVAAKAGEEDKQAKADAEELAGIVEDESRWSLVTCGSAVKLRHKTTNVRLQSHEIGYGSGSEQQSVTGQPDAGDPNSYWRIEAGTGRPRCRQGDKLQHGDVIRLVHLGTNKRLHSHEYQSPLSSKQEVSAFRDDNNENDAGDDWELMVKAGDDAYSSSYGGPWRRDSMVRLKHVVTKKYLFSHSKRFRNGPVEGHTEVAAIGRAEDRTLWKIEEGIFYPAKK